MYTPTHRNHNQVPQPPCLLPLLPPALEVSPCGRVGHWALCCHSFTSKNYILLQSRQEQSPWSPVGTQARLLSPQRQGWHFSPQVCMCVSQGAEGLPQLQEAAKYGCSDPAWTPLRHSSWLGDTFSFWLFRACGLAVTRAVERLG